MADKRGYLAVARASVEPLPVFDDIAEERGNAFHNGVSG
jgi:hypothetical protein